MTNAVIRKVFAAVAAVFITLTGALAATVHTTTDLNGHTFSYTLDHNNNATIVRSEEYVSFSGLVALPASCGGQNVIAVGDNAFKECKEITAIILPNSIERIGDYAFANCTSLSYVGRHLENPGGVSILPDKTKHIGKGAFDGTAVWGVDYPKGSYWGVDDATNTTVKALTIPGWVKTIPEEAFKNYAALESVTIEAGVSSIGRSAFEGCTALKTVRIGEGLEVIENTAFYGCSALTSIELPSTVCTSKGNAFYGCHAMSEVRIPDLSSWCRLTFENNAANPMCGFTAGESSLWVGGRKVETLRIPSDVQEIMPYAFYKLSLTGGLEIPGQVKKIGDYAFYDLYFGDEIRFENGLEEIGEAAFREACYDKAGLGKWNGEKTLCCALEFPASLKKIGSKAFSAFAQLEAVKFGGGLREIGDEAFASLTHIQSLDFGRSSSVTNIGSRAFAACGDYLRSIVIPATVVCMGTEVFANDDSLSKVCYQGNCPWVLRPAYSTANVNDGTSTAFASYVRPGSRGWDGTPESTEKPLRWEGATLGVWQDDGLLIRPNDDGSELAIGGWIPAPSKLVTLPTEFRGKPITSIAARAFEGEATITGVTVGEGICDIGANAFSESFVSDVILPNSVSNIAAQAFYGLLPYLRTLSVGDGLASIATDAFDIFSAQRPTLTVYAPAGKVDMLTTAFHGNGQKDLSLVIFKTDEKAPAITTPTIRITWETMGGWYQSTVTFAEGVTLAEVLPSAPNTSRVGYHFKGWSFDPDEWQPIADSSKQGMPLTENQTFYAWWTKASECYVTWNATGGTVSPEKMTIASGTKVRAVSSAAPVPVRAGWTFDGWYWDEELTDPLSAADSQEATIEFDVMFFAKWVKSGNPQPVDPQPVDPQPVDPQPVDPQPVDPMAVDVPVAEPAGSFAVPKADVLNGVLVKDGAAFGVLQVKVGKESKGESKVSVTVIGLDGKKYTSKAEKVPTGGTATQTFEVKKLGTLTLAFGANGFSGSLNGAVVTSVDATAAVADGKATFAAGDLSSLPGVLTKYLPADELVTRTEKKWAVRVKAGKLKYVKPNEKKNIAGGLEATGSNIAGLKLTYTPKTQTFKGSFKVWTFDEAKKKLKSVSAKVTGVVVNGNGYGEVVVKKAKIGELTVK